MMTGKDVIKDIYDFIKSNKLQDVELGPFEDLVFSVYLDEEKRDEIEYTFDPVRWEETIKHLVWDIDDGEDCHSTTITREEAMKLRFPNNKIVRARRYQILLDGYEYTDPFERTDFYLRTTQEIKHRFLPLCAMPGKRSPILEKISMYNFKDHCNIYVFATKENFEKMLSQMEYVKIYPGGKSYYKFIKFKEE
jgi:hypothetical protein